MVGAREGREREGEDFAEVSESGDDASFRSVRWPLSFFHALRLRLPCFLEKPLEFKPALRHGITKKPDCSPCSEGEDTAATEGRGRKGRRRGRGRFVDDFEPKLLTGFAPPGRLGAAFTTAHEQDNRVISLARADGGRRGREEGIPEAKMKEQREKKRR